MINLNISIPEGFLCEEELCEHIVAKQMKEVWAVEIDLFCELMRVCHKYNLKPFAAYGTKLGAVRHKGFIPWDDDIDLGMTRDDFDCLCKVAQKEFKEPYFFQTSKTDIGTEPGVAKLRNSNTTAIQKSKGKRKKYNQGIFLDIFVYDKMIEDNCLLKKQMRKVKWYHFLYRFAGWITTGYSSEWKGIKGLGLKVLHYTLGPFATAIKLQEKSYTMLENQAKKYNSKELARMLPLMQMWTSWHNMDFVEREYLVIADEINSELMPFEFLTMPVGRNYSEQLHRLFGNYMEFVKGTATHGEMIFDTDKSYKYYIKDAR